MNPSLPIRAAACRVLLLLLLATLAGLSACSRPSPSPDAEPAADHDADHDTPPDAAHDARHPEAHAPAADAADASTATALRLGDEALRKAGVSLDRAGACTIRQGLPLYGTVVPDAERLRQVGARFPGVIQQVGPRVGDAVRQGQTLAVVESNESLRSYPVISPLSGVVLERNANVGEQAGERPLFTVADLASVWVELAVFPRDVAHLRIGQTVQVSAAEVPAPSNGTLLYLAPFGNSSSQARLARVRLDNRDRHWAPGRFVDAEVLLSDAPAPVCVLTAALQTLDGQRVVFVRQDPSLTVRRVQTGRGDATHTEILAGLSAGETYAAQNSFVLKSQLGAATAEHSH